MARAVAHDPAGAGGFRLTRSADSRDYFPHAHMLSVVIPTRDRPTALRDCLTALAAEAAGVLEVIVVDDGGRTPAAAVVDAFAARLPVRCLRRENGGPAAARNAGAELARGDRLAFLDDDCQVTPGWLDALETRCRRHPDAMIGGPSFNALDDDLYAAGHQLLLEYLHERFNPVPEAAVFCASNNLSVPTLAFRELGGFDPGFRHPAGEDRDLCRRWRAAGRPLVYAPEIEVRHAHAMTARSFWRQHFRYGRGARRFHRLGGASETGGRSGEHAGFYLGLLAQPFRRARAPRSFVLFLLLLATQVATIAGYVVETVRGAALETSPVLGRRPVLREVR